MSTTANQPTALIPITQDQIDGQQCNTVNARDLHTFLEVGKDFSTWIKVQIERARLVEGRDFVIATAPPEGGLAGNRGVKKEYYLTLDAGKHVAMMSGTDKGFEVRDYFIECERQTKQLPVPKPKPKEKTIVPMSREFRALLSIAKTAGLKGNPAIISASNAHNKLFGQNPLEVIGATHLISETQIRHFTSTDLGKMHGDISAIKFNRLLAEKGIQISTGEGDSKYWQPTELGQPHAVLVDTTRRHSNGTMIQQLLWLESVLDLLV